MQTETNTCGIQVNPTCRSVMSQVVEARKKMSDKSRYIFVIFDVQSVFFSFKETQVTPTVFDAATEVARDVETKVVQDVAIQCDLLPTLQQLKEILTSKPMKCDPISSSDNTNEMTTECSCDSSVYVPSESSFSR